MCENSIGLYERKPAFSDLRRKTVAQSDQCFIYSLLESIISRLATIEIVAFYLVSVAEGTGLNFALSETWMTHLLALIYLSK